MLILKLMEFFIAHSWFYGLGIGALPLALNTDDQSKSVRTIFFGIAILSLAPVASILLAPSWADHLDVGLEYAVIDLILYPVAVVASLYSVWWFLRVGAHHWEVFMQRFKKRSALERNRRTDVREISKFLPQPIGQFDPLRYIDDERGIFVGLSEVYQPIFIPYEKWKKSHLLLSGQTGSGKGVAAQIILSQAIQRGEFCTLLDPKFDAWLPHVFKDACEKSGYPWCFLDLRQGAHPQINMFEGCDEETIENMLIAAFSLAEKGDIADHHRIHDRRAALQVARHCVAEVNAGRPCPTAADVYKQFGEAWEETAPGFKGAMEEMAELRSVNRANGGIDINAMAQVGGMLYVVGDMGNTRIIRMQRMLLVRLMMLAKKRDYITTTPRTITVFADEFKAHISKPFMTGLGAARSWGMHCILAFQSLQDLADTPADLDKDVVRGAVMENCALSVSYQIKDPETAEWLARSTGNILVDDESRKLKKNLAQSETFDDERTVRLAERYYIDENMFMKLPEGCAVLSGASELPVFCCTSRVEVQQNQAAITPTVQPPTAVDVNEIALDDIPEI